MNDTSNPYAATGLPESPLSESISHIVPASQGKRFLNLVVDQIILFFLQTAFGVAFILLLGEERSQSLDGLSGFMISISIMVGYYILFEATTSRTLGKLLTGTMVVNEQGQRPSFGQVAGRSFARLIPFEAFTFLKSPPRGIHDSVAKTYVVNSR